MPPLMGMQGALRCSFSKKNCSKKIQVVVGQMKCGSGEGTGAASSKKSDLGGHLIGLRPQGTGLMSGGYPS